MPRKKNESYVHLIWGGGPARKVTSPYRRNGNCLDIKGNDCPYICGEYVAKSCDQVGRKASNTNEIITNDGHIFNKISQSINSSFDIIINSHSKGDNENSVISIVLPFLIVPENKIWVCNYTDDGNRENEPEKVKHITYYIGKLWKIEDNGYLRGASYMLSHLEVCEFDNLEQRMEQILEKLSFSEDKLDMLSVKVEN